MEHHWVGSMLIAFCLLARKVVPDDKMSDECNYDDDEELDFALRSASLRVDEIEIIIVFVCSKRIN